MFSHHSCLHSPFGAQPEPKAMLKGNQLIACLMEKHIDKNLTGLPPPSGVSTPKGRLAECTCETYDMKTPSISHPDVNQSTL